MKQKINDKKWGWRVTIKEMKQKLDNKEFVFNGIVKNILNCCKCCDTCYFYENENHNDFCKLHEIWSITPDHFCAEWKGIKIND